MNFLASKKQTERVVVVEIEKGQRVPPLNESTAQSVATLQGHPGFQYLLAKCKFQKSVLEAQLKGRRQESIREVEFLQSGIAWAGWLQDQLEGAINFHTPVADTSVSEKTIFEESQRMLDVLK